MPLHDAVGVKCKKGELLNTKAQNTTASLTRDLARIQEWCNHWFMILNYNKT